MSEGGGLPRKPGPDTGGALAVTRTVPSERNEKSAAVDPAASSPPTDPPPMGETREAPEAGETLGDRYRILAEVGRGAEGVVYRARDLKADTVVALKLLRHDEGSDGRLRRFRRELQLARKVTHPNVVRIYDLVELPGRFGLSMELVDGEALDERLARGKLGRDALVRLAVDLARALAAAHEAGVTHRDLKPGNVLLRARDGHAVVTDFGVSRAHAGADAWIPADFRPSSGGQPVHVTREGALVGTPLYMAPEQLEGRPDVGPAADVYAFGAVVFEAATGRPPHEGDTVARLLRRKTSDAAPPLRERRPDVPKVLCDVVDRCLRAAPAERYATGVELLAALEPLASPARTRAPAWPLGLGLLAVAGGAAALLTLVRSPPAIPPPAPHPTAPPPLAPPSTPPLALSVSNARPVTFGDACEEFPSFTPDGRAIVYDGTIGRDSFIYRLELERGATARQLTRVRGWDIAASVSPDGARLAFLRIEGEHVGAYVGPLDGSEPPHLVVKGALRPSWSTDGAAVWAGAGDPIASYDATTGALKHAFPQAPRVRTAVTLELADGDLLTAFTADEDGESPIGGVALLHDHDPPRWLLQQSVQEALAATADGRHALVSRTTSTGVELMDVPIDGAPAASLAAAGIEAREGIALSGDGSRVVWSTCKEVSHLASIDRHDRSFRPIRADVVGPSRIATLPDRAELVVLSTRSGKPEPWIVPLSGDQPPRPIDIGALRATDVAVAHDGVRFVVSVPRHGLHVGRIDGSVPLRALTTTGTDSAPAFRAGDAQIVFTRHRSDGQPQLMTVPVEGGDATELMAPGSDGAAPSPVDDRVAYLAGGNGAELVPTLWDGKAGTRRPLSPKLAAGRYGSLTFSPDGRRLALVRGQTEIVEVDVVTGAVDRSLSTPTDDQLGSPVYTSSGFAAVRVRWQGNVWMADLGSPPP
jgi:serine/threonine protein kinase/Tol biopolymer transport system component